MMRNKMIWGLMLGLMVVAAPVMGQTVSSQSEMPAVQEAPADAGESGLLSGEDPFTLMVDDNVGEMVYQFDDETKELESIIAKRGVIFASEDMTLNADEMEYHTINSSLVATGKRVVVRMGEMIITCKVFKYNPETQEGQFEGSPIVYQRNKDGQVTETAGRIISVVNVNGKFQMRVGSGGGISTYLRSTGVAPESGSLEKKTLAPGQRGASMTINSNTAPGASSSSNGNAEGGLFGSVPNIDADSAPSAPGASTQSRETEATPPAASNGQINPDNPADVQQYTEKKSE